MNELDIEIAKLTDKAPSLWHPSTDIRAAWELVEEMCETCRVDVRSFGKTGVNVQVYGIGFPSFVIGADTVEEAICQTYLAWMERGAST